MNTETLDDTDIEILRILQRNANLTVKELADMVHLSTSPVFERQKRLEREGYIKRYVALLDAEKLGQNVIVFCNIRLKKHTRQHMQEFMEAVQKIRNISECYNTSGDYDFMIKVYAKDMKDYQNFVMNTLGTLDCLGSLHSIFVLDETKTGGGVPVR